MTHNQIEFAKLKESTRHNLVSEKQSDDVNKETSRHNRAQEGETERHNVATESETSRHNAITENEAGRHNLATEQETNRSNLASEDIRRQTNSINSYLASESSRHNYANEQIAALNAAEIARHNLENEREVNRHAVVTEGLQKVSTVVGSATQISSTRSQNKLRSAQTRQARATARNINVNTSYAGQANARAWVSTIVGGFSSTARGINAVTPN